MRRILILLFFINRLDFIIAQQPANDICTSLLRYAENSYVNKKYTEAIAAAKSFLDNCSEINNPISNAFAHTIIGISYIDEAES